MADVKWIKIVTNIFDDEKIRYIETLPNGDEVIVIWFRILCLAGKSNSNGMLMMTDRIAYTDEMLSSIFNRDIKSIQVALGVFRNLEMIEMIDDKIHIAKWEKHQNIDGLDRIREANRLRNIEYRNRKKGEIPEDRKDQLPHDISHDIIMISDDSIEEDIELEEEKENKNKKKENKKHKYGQFNNVQLTDDQIEALKQIRTDYQAIIQYFDSYIEEKGYKSKNHYLTIRRWVIEAYDRDKSKPIQKRINEPIPDYKDDKPKMTEEEVEELKKRLRRAIMPKEN